jgi:cytochrome P450
MDSSVGGIFMRIATKDHYLGNLKIYKGTVVNVRIRGMHYK